MNELHESNAEIVNELREFDMQLQQWEAVDRSQMNETDRTVFDARVAKIKANIAKINELLIQLEDAERDEHCWAWCDEPYCMEQL